MAKARAAMINGKPSVERIAGRLARVRQAVVNLECNAQDSGILDIAYRRRCRDKARKLRQEEQALADQLKAIRAAINNTVDV